MDPTIGQRQHEIANQKRRKGLKWGLIGALIVFALLQVQSLTQNYENPPVRQEPDWNSAQTRQLTVRACYDCHSNEVVWPWYGRLFPMSVMVREDVEKGREVLNFSEWGPDGFNTDVEDLVELVSKGEMPLPYYRILHPKAQLTDIETGQLIHGLMETLNTNNGPLDLDKANNTEARAH